MPAARLHAKPIVSAVLARLSMEQILVAGLRGITVNVLGAKTHHV
jgi:hypothetical protein